MKKEILFNNVFSIPYQGKYILYFPLHKTALLVNNNFINLLCQARKGDKNAIDQLGVNEEYISSLFNQETKINKLKSIRTPPPFKPTHISLFLTNNCTLRCQYCYANGGKNEQYMHWDIVSGVIENIIKNARKAENKTVTVNFHGGGDVSVAWNLLVKTRSYLKKLADAAGISVNTSIGINGILNHDQREWIVKNINSATISIDGPAEIHNFQRPFPDNKPSFSIVDETIKYFDSTGFDYGIRSTITSRSVNQLKQIVAFFCQQYKVKSIKVEPMFPRGRGEKS